jgi:hypothetical protein
MNQETTKSKQQLFIEKITNFEGITRFIRVKKSSRSISGNSGCALQIVRLKNQANRSLVYIKDFGPDRDLEVDLCLALPTDAEHITHSRDRVMTLKAHSYDFFDVELIQNHLFRRVEKPLPAAEKIPTVFDPKNLTRSDQVYASAIKSQSTTVRNGKIYLQLVLFPSNVMVTLDTEVTRVQPTMSKGSVYLRNLAGNQAICRYSRFRMVYESEGLPLPPDFTGVEERKV